MLCLMVAHSVLLTSMVFQSRNPGAFPRTCPNSLGNLRATCAMGVPFMHLVVASPPKRANPTHQRSRPSSIAHAAKHFGSNQLSLAPLPRHKPQVASPWRRFRGPLRRCWSNCTPSNGVCRLNNWPLQGRRQLPRVLRLQRLQRLQRLRPHGLKRRGPQFRPPRGVPDKPRCSGRLAQAWRRLRRARAQEAWGSLRIKRRQRLLPSLQVAFTQVLFARTTLRTSAGASGPRRSTPSSRAWLP